MTQIFSFAVLRASLAIGVIALSTSGPAQAIVYDFSKMTGGAQSSLAWAGSDIFVEVTENSATPANDVLFKFTNAIPPPSGDSVTAKIIRIRFDTGTITDLFTGMSILQQSAGVSLTMPSSPTDCSSGCPFLPASYSFSTDYQIDRSSTSSSFSTTDGINPGEYLIATATLGAGKSFTDVTNAMSVGMSNPTVSSGLRISASVQQILGSQLSDDAAFLAAKVVAVPEADTWAMMLAGLGLLGLMARRRTA